MALSCACVHVVFVCVPAQVVIPAGRSIILDVSPPPLRSLTVLGRLLFEDRRDVILHTNVLTVDGGGVLEVGTALQPFTHKATIRLFSIPTTSLTANGGTHVLFLGAH